LRAVLLILLGIVAVSGLYAEPVDFMLPDLDGKQRRLSEFRGKWVLVNYWATWCPPCLEELPELEIFHLEHQHRDAVVIGVNLEDIDLTRLRTFVENQFISFPILREKPGSRTALGAVPAMPTSYLVAPNGELVARQVGMVDAKMIERYIETYNEQIEKVRKSEEQ
jgi:peroxiredoxin